MCLQGLVPTTYETFQFLLAPGELGTNGHYLLLGLQVKSGAHMRLRDVLLAQPGYTHESPATTLPWMEPPFAAPCGPSVLDTPQDQRTPKEIEASLKARYLPVPVAGKRPREKRWVTTCFTTEPSEVSVQTYLDWETCASLYVSVNILINTEVIRYSGFKGQPSSTANGLLVRIACGL